MIRTAHRTTLRRGSLLISLGLLAALFPTVGCGGGGGSNQGGEKCPDGQYRDTGGTCRPPSCDPDAELNLAATCAAEHRVCDDDATNGAECGSCVDGFVWDGSDCVEVVTCGDLTCSEQNREGCGSIATRLGRHPQGVPLP